MLSRFQIVTACLVLTSCASTARAQPAPSREAQQKVYVDYLKREGYLPEVDPDGNVTFKVEGGRYVVLIDAKDPGFFQLAFTGFWKVDTEADRQKALAAANLATMRTKVAKVIVLKGTVAATFEAFVKEPGEFATFFSRALTGLRLAVRTFAEEMSKK